jgi:hypothetical protein
MRPKQQPQGVWSKPIRHFYSIKNQARFWCESLLERDALLVMEFDDTVEAYKAQPVSFTYSTVSGKIARYTPDQLVKFKAAERLVFREVKMASRVNDALQEKIEWIRRHIRSIYDAELEIITDQDVRQGSSIDNFNALYPYKRVCIAIVELERIKRKLPQEISFRELKERSGQLGLTESIPYALLAHGAFKFKVAELLSEETILHKA